MTALNDRSASTAMAQWTQHVAELRRVVFVPGNLERVRDFVHDDVVDHFAPATDPPGITGFIERFTAAQGAIHAQGIDVLVSSYQDGILFQAIRMNLVHSGDFMGIPASGKEIAIGGMDAFKFRDDKIAEHWGIYDVSKIAELVSDGAGATDRQSMWDQSDRP